MAVLQLTPSVLPADWDDICAEQNISAGVSMVKLVHDLSAVPSAETDLRVGRVEAGEAAQWGSALVRGAGMPEEGLAQLFGTTVGRSGFRGYAAWDGGELVSAANLYIHMDVAELLGASTLPSHRRRGASALLAARIREAVAAGCRWVFAETGKEERSRNPSLPNMIKAGFEVAYERRNWIWRPAA